ncbi:MAG: GAF domain-containing protein [Pseudomonadota bacterium]
MPIAAPIPTNEQARLGALYSYEILDTPAEESFDRITLLASQICDAPIALVSLVDEARQWFKSRHGLKAEQTDRSLAFCAHAILTDQTFVVTDATRDPRFCDSPLVTGPPDIRAYAGAPLIADEGVRLGTLCVICREPTLFTRRQLRQLESLAAITVDTLVLRRALNNSCPR